MEPVPGKSAFAFFGVLLALFLPAILAQWASPVAGLAATEIFCFLVPTLVATTGSNLRVVPWLRLRAPRPGLVALGALTGATAYLVAGALMTFTQQLLPRSWVEANDVARLFAGPAWERIALALIAAALAPACEEITFRGYVQSSLGLGRRPAAAVAGAAALFAVLHFDPVRLPALFLLGCVFGWLTWRSGSVWPAVAAHAVNNGISAALLLAAGPPPEGAAPPASELLAALALGAAMLLAVLLLVSRAAPPRPPGAEPVALRDPGRASIRFHAALVPRPLALSALLGGALLLALAVLGVARGLTRVR